MDTLKETFTESPIKAAVVDHLNTMKATVVDHLNIGKPEVDCEEQSGAELLEPLWALSGV